VEQEMERVYEEWKWYEEVMKWRGMGRSRTATRCRRWGGRI